MEFEAVIGLEIHAEMKTKSKMFSSSKVTFGDCPNTHVAPLDMAFPGALPTVNKQAVINAIRVCHALHMNIDSELWFDRKNYFYSDLPKGYQITQDKRPIGKNGYVDIDTSSGRKRIGTQRLHIEEDTCKQIHLLDCSLLDYNRAGIPLIEITTEPELKTGEEAMRYVEKIRSIISFLDVSNGKMEEGSLRCDVNVSLKKKSSNAFGTRVEIKNLNTLNNIQRAIDYEISRQKQLLENGQQVIKETRRFDESTKTTVPMRLKVDSIDYKFYTDPNILPFKMSKEFIEEAIRTAPELAEQKLVRYKQYGLSDYDCSQLLANKETSDYFDEMVKLGANPKLAANWIIVDVQTVLNKQGISIDEFIIRPNELSKLINLIFDKKISNKQARTIFQKVIQGSEKIDEFITDEEAQLINDVDQIRTLVIEAINNNPQSVIDYHNGRDKAVGYLVGQIMKITQGKVNPGLTNKIVLEELKRR